MALVDCCWFSTISMYGLQIPAVSSITYCKWFSEKLRDRLFQKVKRSKRNYHELLLLVNLYKFFFPLDDFALYILPCSEKENTLKETFTKVKLKVPLWCSHYYTSNHILLLTILCKFEFLWSPYKNCWQNSF